MDALRANGRRCAYGIMDASLMANGRLRLRDMGYWAIRLLGDESIGDVAIRTQSKNRRKVNFLRFFCCKCQKNVVPSNKFLL